LASISLNLAEWNDACLFFGKDSQPQTCGGDIANLRDEVALYGKLRMRRRMLPVRSSHHDAKPVEVDHHTLRAFGAGLVAIGFRNAEGPTCATGKPERNAHARICRNAIPEELTTQMIGWKGRAMLDRYHIIAKADLDERAR
jgi:hypothetical protein